MIKDNEIDIFYVYEHWRTDKNICFYVGKGQRKRAFVLYGRGKHYNDILKSIKETGGTVNVKIISNNLLENEAFNFEIERIKFWRRESVHLANLTDGGDGLTNPSEETRCKMSESAKKRLMTPERLKILRQLSEKKKGIPHSKEHAEKIGKANRGRTISKETREKISNAVKGKTKGIKRGPFTEEHKRRISESKIGKSSPLKGTNLSEETRDKMKLAWVARKERIYTSIEQFSMKGKSHSAEAKRKIGESAKQRKVSKETKIKISIASKKSWERRKEKFSD